MQFDQKRPRTEVAAQAFGLAKFSVIYNISHNPHAFVRHIWLATLRGVWKRAVTVGRISYEFLNDKKDVEYGLVLIEHPDYKQHNFLGENPIRAVELAPTDDTVMRALQNINLFEAAINMDFRELVAIDMDIAHPNGERQIYGNSFEDEIDPTWARLKDSLIDSIKAFTPLYDDQLMSEFIETQYEK